MLIKKQVSNESENSASFDRWIIDITELQSESEKEFFKEPSVRELIRSFYLTLKDQKLMTHVGVEDSHLGF